MSQLARKGQMPARMLPVAVSADVSKAEEIRNRPVQTQRSLSALAGAALTISR